MEFLRLLEGLRTPFFDTVFAAVTHLGEETFFMVLAILLFWCINKRFGYYCFFVGFAGTAINQFLKLLCRIPRPWVLDPDFTIVEAARAQATGYSFPSGHTQNAVGTFAVLGLATKKKWLKILCAVLIIIVPFSRMYLGVHTPLDVSVAFFSSLLLVALLWPCCKNEERFQKAARPLLIGTCILCALYVGFVCAYQFPADVDADNLFHGTKNAYTLLGCALGLVITYWYDSRKLRFSTEAPFWGQVLKLALGLGIVMGIRMGLKPLLNLVFGDRMFNNAIRYFVIVLFCGCLWPKTFPFWAKIGKK